MAAVTFSWGVTLVVRKEVTGDKEGKEKKKGGKGGGYVCGKLPYRWKHE